MGGVPGPGGGVPGPGRYLVWGEGVYLVLEGVPGPGVYLVLVGGYLVQGCVPGPGGTWLGGTWSLGGYLLQGGVPAPGGYLLRYSPPVDRMTHTCKNITFPQTLFAGGKIWARCRISIVLL